MKYQITHREWDYIVIWSVLHTGSILFLKFRMNHGDNVELFSALIGES